MCAFVYTHVCMCAYICTNVYVCLCAHTLLCMWRLEAKLGELVPSFYYVDCGD